MTLHVTHNNIVHKWLLIKNLTFAQIHKKAISKAQGKTQAIIQFFKEDGALFAEFKFRNGKLCSFSLL